MTSGVNLHVASRIVRRDGDQIQRAPRVLRPHQATLVNGLPCPTAHGFPEAGIARDSPDVVAWVLQEVRDRGPITAAEIEQDVVTPKQHRGWNWSDAKAALEWLYWTGEVSTARRNGSFARVYDLTERVLPRSFGALPAKS